MNAVPLLHDHLLESARRLPGKMALVAGSRQFTFCEIDGRSNALAHALVRSGVERGDRVVVFADNTPEAVIAFWAALKANAVAVVVSPQTRPDKLAYLLHDCAAAAFINEHALAPG